MTRNAAHPRGLTGRHVALMFVLFFGTIAAVNAVLVWTALKTWAGAETVSAYRAGQLYNAEFAQAHAFAAKGWRVDITADRRRDGTTALRLRARDAAGRGLDRLAVTALLQRPANAREDRRLDLDATAEAGVYAASIADLAPGQWEAIADLSERGELAFRRSVRLVLR